jgi:polysaccharide biosynthesis transport protein
MSNELPTPIGGTAGPPVVPNSTGLLPYHPGEEDEGGGFALRRYMAAILRFRWAILALTLVGGLAGWFAMRFATPTYRAQATLWLETTGRADLATGPIRSAELFSATAWTDLLRSYVVLDYVVRDQRLYLDVRPTDREAVSGFELRERFRPGKYRLQVGRDGQRWTLTTAEGMQIEEGAVGDSIGRSMGFSWVLGDGQLWPGRRLDFAVTTPREAAVRLGHDLRINMPRQGSFLMLQLHGPDAARVAATLNSVTDRFTEVAGELKKAKLTQLAQILEEQLSYAATTLRDEEITLENFRVNTITLPTDRGSPVAGGVEVTRSPVYDNFFSLKLEREQIRRDREEILQVLSRARAGDGSVTSLEMIGAVRQTSNLESALKELTEKRAAIRAYGVQYMDSFPPMVKLRADIDQLEHNTIPSLADRLVRELAAREVAVEATATSAGEQLRSIPPRAIEEARLARRVHISENLYRTLQQRYEEAKLAAVTSIADVRVLDAATVPHVPSNDPRTMVFMAFLAAGLGLGVGGAVLRDMLDSRLRYADQVSRDLGLTVLGAVPELKLNQGQSAEVSAHAMESFRGIRLNLANAYGSAGPVVVTVTSPGSGDGKSFVSSNLALSFADLGHRTLLIDGDIRRGGLHRLMNSTRKPGLIDFLAGKAALDGIVKTTSFKNLDFIPSGARMQQGPELLGSPAMREMLAEMRQRYSVILIDSPPLGAGVDPFILSTLAGNVILTVRTGITEKELAETKLDLLSRLPLRILGAVLNGISPKDGAYRYYSYIGGYEAADEKPGAEPRQLQGV